MEPKIGVIMGSKSDWETMKHTCDILDELEVPYEKKVVSAHRTPDFMFEYAEQAQDKGLEIIIAGAGGAAHLPGMVAAKTLLPVIGIPVQSKALNGMDSLIVHCSNAWRCSSCDDGDWESRRCERRSSCGTNVRCP